MASLDTFFGAPGPFTAELAQFSLRLIGHYFINVLSREVKFSLVSHSFNATGNNNIILFLTTQHHIEGLHMQRQRCFASSDAFSGQIQCLAKVFGPLELCELLPHFRLQT